MSERTYDEQGLPWLEAVDDEDGPRALSGGKMLLAIVLALAAIAAIGGTMFWLGRDSGDTVVGAPELIKADPRPYKVKPSDPGGLDVAGDSSTAFATGAGVDTDAALDPTKIAPAPPPPAADAPKAEPKPTPKPVPAPDPAAPAGGPMIQLGAYGSVAKAETAWGILSGRFPAVAALSKRIEKYSSGYRLRAVAPSSAAASAACKQVVAGGENCFAVR